jgi:hypothetical protein
MTYTKVPTRATTPLAALNAGIDSAAACAAIAKLCKFTRRSQLDEYLGTENSSHSSTEHVDFSSKYINLSPKPH